MAHAWSCLCGACCLWDWLPRCKMDRQTLPLQRWASTAKPQSGCGIHQCRDGQPKNLQCLQREYGSRRRGAKRPGRSQTRLSYIIWNFRKSSLSVAFMSGFFSKTLASLCASHKLFWKGYFRLSLKTRSMATGKQQSCWALLVSHFFACTACLQTTLSPSATYPSCWTCCKCALSGRMAICSALKPEVPLCACCTNYLQALPQQKLWAKSSRQSSLCCRQPCPGVWERLSLYLRP
mmetsp:Transcript_18179/g.46552  ORF Transcript_18179/g.46552 Transcript_18179/m.46552 type:complete len:235 (+) Transcript_18179:4584-5288(+)